MATGTVQVLEREFLPPEQAKELLGRSLRSLQRLARDGNVRFQVTKAKERLYHAGDILHVKEHGIKAGREEPGEAPTRALSLAPPTTELVERVIDRLTAPAPVPCHVKLWLTMAEAIELSGLPRKTLRALCRDGELNAFCTGSRHLHWRIQRKSLEAYEGPK